MLDDNHKRHVGEIYLKVASKLGGVYLEACGARNNDQLSEIYWKINNATLGVDIAGPEHYPISDAVSALQLAWGVQKIKGGAGSAAYEKIGNLEAMGRAILDQLKSSTGSTTLIE